MSSGRAEMLEQQRLLYQIAEAYYRERRTQEEIARTYGFSRSRVVQLLSEAQYCGVVDIFVDYPARWHEQAQSRLRAFFSGVQIYVIPARHFSISASYDAACSAAADYCNGIISNRAVMSISRGKTMLRMTQFLNPYQSYPGMMLQQLTGMMDNKEPFYEEMDLIRRVSDLYGCRCRCFALPHIVHSREFRDQLIRYTLPEDHEAQIERVNILFSSISTLEPWKNYLEAKDYQDLQATNAIGSYEDIFLDIQGNVVETPLYSRLISPTETQIRNIQNRVCVASGGYKAQALLAALRSGLVTTAFVDSNLAIKVLNLIETDRYEI